MAFHTACPITCRKICDCELGFHGELKEKRAREGFLGVVSRVEGFLDDPWILRGGGDGTVQVRVPRVKPAAEETTESPERERVRVEEVGGGRGEEVVAVPRAPMHWAASRPPTQWALLLKEKREALREQAAAASQAAEEYVRKLEGGVAADVSREVPDAVVGEDQGSSTIKVICRICFSGENESSERAAKMLSCKLCNKKYHRICLKTWAEYRDLFHWSSWACPSCRVCEVCQRTGDPTKLMFCKRCDDAYHCYCQMPPHKNVSHGPYLCPKHTRCHSCGSTVCGSGHSTRWFLSYTCCDACGRLFVKGNYCPVCLKVYRDSEMTPMVCCDVCQKWVHCVCDGISDEKYRQFGRDGNLKYNCAACRGECYQVKDMDDTVRELWRRKDKADSHLTASLRSAAGLPTEKDTIYPFSVDEEKGPLLLENYHEEGFSDKSPKSAKKYKKTFPQISSPNTQYGKKGDRVKPRGNPEEQYQNTGKQQEPKLNRSSFKGNKPAHNKSFKSDGQGILLSPNIRTPESDKEKPLVEHEPSTTLKECMVNCVNSVSKVHIKGTKTRSLHLKGVANNVGKNETAKGTKLVILLGAKNGNTTSSPRFEASSCQKDQDFADGNDSGGNIQQNDVGKNLKLATPGDGEGGRLDNAALTRPEYEEGDSKVAKLRKVSDMHRKSRNDMSEEHKHSSLCIQGKKNAENVKVLPSKQTVRPSINLQSQNHDSSEPLPSNSSDDPKPLLKLKFKRPYFEQRSSLASKIVEKKAVKGKRSKRKRPSLERLMSILPQKESRGEFLNANSISQKLGRNAGGE